MSYTMYTPLNVWLDPASVTDVVAYIQTYLSENTIYSETEIETLIHDYLIAHPELIGGVTSVNGKTGIVVLSASDINTENNVTIESVLSALGSQISTIAASVATNTANITNLTGRVSTAETDISDLKSNLGCTKINTIRNYQTNGDRVTNLNIVADGTGVSFTLTQSGEGWGVYQTGDPLFKSGKKYIVSFDVETNINSLVTIITRSGRFNFFNKINRTELFVPTNTISEVFYTIVSEPCNISITNYYIIELESDTTKIYPMIATQMSEVADIKNDVFNDTEITGVYPASYYKNFVTSLNATSGRTLFAIQTDTHYGERNARFSSENFRHMYYLTRMTEIPIVSHLGDLVNGATTKSSQLTDISKAISAYNQCKAKYIQLVGNHDDNSWYDHDSAGNKGLEVIKPDEWGRMVCEPMTVNDQIITFPNKRYGLYEDGVLATRFIFLDTVDIDYLLKNGDEQKYAAQWKFAIRQEQIDFLINALKNIGSAYRIVILSHNTLADEQSGVSVINANIVRGILEAFKNRTTYSGSSSITDFECSVNVDFSSATGTLIGCFAGHGHSDNIYTVNGINYIQTDNASVFDDDTGRSRFDQTADVIDVVRVNFSTKTVTLKRFGYGADRTFSYT